jgi:hypothetical protein
MTWMGLGCLAMAAVAHAVGLYNTSQHVGHSWCLSTYMEQELGPRIKEDQLSMNLISRMLQNRCR